jgi:hypothetical protein
MRKFILSLLFAAMVAPYSNAQELRCNVQVVSQKIQGSNKQVFRTLQQAIYEFMNNTNWTNHVYAQNERIECNIMINLTEQIGSDEFIGEMQIQCRRPVYNTSYNTVLLNMLDEDIRFRYIEFEPLEFNPTTHSSNLTSILAYYAYLILGIDYDSFGYEGGTELFKMAERIVNNAVNAPEPGWKPMDTKSAKEHRNRYWIMQSLLEDEFSGIREFYYRYHRLGLDIMDAKLAEGRAQILESLELLQDVKRKKPDPFMHLLRLALEAKSDEIINVFQEGSVDEKSRAQKLLVELDPSNSKKYEAITKQ